MTEARHLALCWLDCAIEVGGITGARMLARKASFVPTSFAEVRDRALALFRREDEEGIGEICAFGQQLSIATTDETRILAKATARRLLREREDPDIARLTRSLLDVCGDGALRADARLPAPPAPKRARTGIAIDAFACTDVGSKRDVNEDACLASLLDVPPIDPQDAMAIQCDASESGVVLGVFDGLGGWDAEESADAVSRMAAKRVTQSLRRAFPTHATDPEPWASALAASVEEANRALLQIAEESLAHRGLGTTAVVATPCGDQLIIAHVGDSRAYLFRNEALVPITRDHSFLNDWIDKRKAAGTPPTSEEIALFPHKNVIVRALGMSKFDIDILRVELRDGDILLLCTDGLSSVVPEDDIRAELMKFRTPEQTARALIQKALDAGGPDNIAIVVARLSGKGLPPRRRGPVVFAPLRPPPFAYSEAQMLQRRTTPLELRRPYADRGTMAVHDAAELPDGRMLVALGEVGLWLLSRDGKVLTRFAEPASHIVLSSHGDRAILLARRGDVYRVSRLDLLTKRLRPWCDARFDVFAPEFDGDTWFIARDDTAYAIDATAEDWEHLWKIDDRGSRVCVIRRDDQQVAIWFAKSEGPDEIWSFQGPVLTLRRRRPITKPDSRVLAGAISATGSFAGWRAGDGEAFSACAFVNETWKDLGISSTLPPGPPSLVESWIAISVAKPEATTIHLVDRGMLEPRARIELEGAIRASGVRFQHQHLVVFDGLGRILLLSLRTGAVLREYRVS